MELLLCRSFFGVVLGGGVGFAGVLVVDIPKTSVCGTGGAGGFSSFWLCFVAWIGGWWWQGGGGYFLKRWHRGQLLNRDLQKIFFNLG